MALDWGKIRRQMTDRANYNPSKNRQAAQQNAETLNRKFTGGSYGRNTDKSRFDNNFRNRPNAGGGADYMSVDFGQKRNPVNKNYTYANQLGNDYKGITNTGVSMDNSLTDREEQNLSKSNGGYDKEFKNIAFNLPSLKLMRGIGDGIQNIGRGSRLQGMYQDRAVADGRSKASGYQDFKNDKMSMMTGKDKEFYDKYINLADMAQDNKKRDEYLKVAESAWRNQQTTDRLSTVSQFEDYDISPGADKYFDSTYTDPNKVDSSGNPIFVPGVQRMQEILETNRPAVSNNENAYNDFFNNSNSQMNSLPSEDITESITYDEFFNQPGNNENAYNNFYNNSNAITNEEENLEGLTYNQRFNEDLNANPYNDFFNQPGNNAFPPQTQKKIPSYLNNGLGFFDENEDGEQYYRY